MADDEIQQAAHLANALSNSKRLRIIQELADGPKTLQQLHDKQKNLKYRDSTYRHTEKLHDVGLVNKKYDSKEKKMKYELDQECILFKFSNGEIKGEVFSSIEDICKND